MGDRLNFDEISALVVDSDRYSSGIVGQVLRGFGMSRLVFADTGEEAKNYLGKAPFDLLLTECLLSDMKGANLVRWVRRSNKNSLRHITIILLTGYTHFSNVISARDAGVNSVVRKPVAPNKLYDHISWSAQTERPFIEADQYYGPCRRFRFGDPVPGMKRRAGDNYPDPVNPRPPEAPDTKEASF